MSNSLSLRSPSRLTRARSRAPKSGVRLLVEDVEHEVVGDGHGQDQPVDLTVLWDVGDAGPERLARRRVGKVLAPASRIEP